METRIDRKELFARLAEIVDSVTDSPASQLIALGTALVKMGEALQGVSVHDAKAVLQAVAALHGIDFPK